MLAFERGKRCIAVALRINVENEQRPGGDDAIIGDRRAAEPFANLRHVDGGIEQSARRQRRIRVFGGRCAAEIAAATARAYEPAILFDRPMQDDDAMAASGEGERVAERRGHAAGSVSACGSNAISARTTAAENASRTGRPSSSSSGTYAIFPSGPRLALPSRSICGLLGSAAQRAPLSC